MLVYIHILFFLFSFYTYLNFSKTYKEVIDDISKADEEKAIGESGIQFEEKLKNATEDARLAAQILFVNLLCVFMAMAVHYFVYIS